MCAWSQTFSTAPFNTNCMVSNFPFTFTKLVVGVAALPRGDVRRQRRRRRHSGRRRSGGRRRGGGSRGGRGGGSRWWRFRHRRQRGCSRKFPRHDVGPRADVFAHVAALRQRDAVRVLSHRHGLVLDELPIRQVPVGRRRRRRRRRRGRGNNRRRTRTIDDDHHYDHHKHHSYDDDDDGDELDEFFWPPPTTVDWRRRVGRRGGFQPV